MTPHCEGPECCTGPQTGYNLYLENGQDLKRGVRGVSLRLKFLENTIKGICQVHIKCSGSGEW